MPNPQQSYLIGGTVYKGPIPTTTRITHVINIAGGGASNLDVYLGGKDTASGIQLKIFLIRNGTLIATTLINATGTNGKWIYDLNNLAYQDNDTVITLGTTVIENADVIDDDFEPSLAGKESYHEEAKAFQNILVDEKGRVHGFNNPFPVLSINEDLSNVNGKRTWTITRGDGQPDNEKVEYKGQNYQRTFTYDSNGFQTERSAWTRI